MEYLAFKESDVKTELKSSAYCTVLPTISSLYARTEASEPSILELLSLMFGNELRRRYTLSRTSNEEGFEKYYTRLHLSVHNEQNYKSYLYLLDIFKIFLGDIKPSSDLAREFIAGYQKNL